MLVYIWSVDVTSMERQKATPKAGMSFRISHLHFCSRRSITKTRRGLLSV